jgi:hypothetical protein
MLPKFLATQQVCARVTGSALREALLPATTLVGSVGGGRKGQELDIDLRKMSESQSSLITHRRRWVSNSAVFFKNQQPISVGV